MTEQEIWDGIIETMVKQGVDKPTAKSVLQQHKQDKDLKYTGRESERWQFKVSSELPFDHHFAVISFPTGNF